MGVQLAQRHRPPPVTASQAAPVVHPVWQFPQRHAEALEVPHAVTAVPTSQRPALQQPPLQRQSNEHAVVHTPLALQACPGGQSRPTLLRHRVAPSVTTPVSRGATPLSTLDATSSGTPESAGPTITSSAVALSKGSTPLSSTLASALPSAGAASALLSAGAASGCDATGAVHPTSNAAVMADNKGARVMRKSVAANAARSQTATRVR